MFYLGTRANKKMSQLKHNLKSNLIINSLCLVRKLNKLNFK